MATENKPERLNEEQTEIKFGPKDDPKGLAQGLHGDFFGEPVPVTDDQEITADLEIDPEPFKEGAD